MPYKNIEINNAGSVSQQAVKQSHFYKGFSSVDNNTAATELFDFELIKQDIINHFQTRRGERVMNPTFGSIIWDLIMEPMSPTTREEFVSDIKSICNSDPRVTPIQMDLTEYETGYFLEITLQSNTTDQSSSMKLQFDQNIGLTVVQQ